MAVLAMLTIRGVVAQNYEPPLKNKKKEAKNMPIHIKVQFQDADQAEAVLVRQG